MADKKNKSSHPSLLKGAIYNPPDPPASGAGQALYQGGIKGGRNPFPAMEEEVLTFWEKNKIFEKSVASPASGAPKGDYVFYDGPPFATGEPHYGHIVASTMKDVVPRYWTMRGYSVERKWGWDCHGLPIENIAEKELGIRHKKEIVAMGVDKFNEFCRTKVLTYVHIWEKVIRRLGRWADMENAYRTMDLSYMESIWWVFKELWDKGLLYEGKRSLHVCPRCETTLSQSEVAEGYKEIKDLSVTAKFELVDEPGTYILAWTTTPWTLIGNAALAVEKDIEYVRIKYQGYHGSTVSPYGKGIYILAKDIVWNNLNESCDKGIKDFLNVITVESLSTDLLVSFQKVRDKFGDLENEERKRKAKDYFFEKYSLKYGFELIKGKDLIGGKYKPLFDYYANDKKLKNRENGWKIYVADFVTTDEGTGIVHIAPAFGEDDMNLGKKENLPFIQHVAMDGSIKPEANDFAGLNVKPIDDHMSTDVEIIKYLAKHDLLFSKGKYAHSYPHCWRCETPLINYVTSSWFVNVLKIKDNACKLAEKINWSPEHIKEGRFGDWLAGARDWSISRQRFWASAIPLWRCDKCGEIKVFGSVAELEKVSGQKITDLHKHIVDKITFPCEKCDGTMKRIPDVLDAWFDSGSMPYAQNHYPFQNKEKFEANFPAEFIAEGVDQTRCWFYYLHILGTAIFKKAAYKNVIVNGIVLAEDGKKMSKRLKNYPDPSLVFDKYGADATRFYLMSSPVVAASNLNFTEAGVKEVLQKNIMILWNVYKFYEQYAEKNEMNNPPDPLYPTVAEALVGKQGGSNVLDQWILARLHQLIAEVTENLNKYDLPRSARPITEFINDFSTWYLRRSRERFKSDDAADKQNALVTTKYVLIELAKVMAPFMPFLAEQLWQRVSGHDFKDENRSVHLEAWPKQLKIKNYELKIIEEMGVVRKIVELGLAKRDEAGIKVRQALNKFSIFNFQFSMNDAYLDLIKDELNVKKVVAKKGKGEMAVELDTTMTEELKLEGLKREIVRLVNAMRKRAGLTIKDRIILSWQSESAIVKKVFSKMAGELKKDTLSERIAESKVEGEAVKANRESVKLGVKKI